MEIDVDRIADAVLDIVEEPLSAFAKRLEAIEKAIAAVPQPKDGRDGKDADPTAVAALVAGDIKKDISALSASVDAMPRFDAEKTASELEARTAVLVEQSVQRAVASLPAAKDGEKGEKGDQGPIGRDGRDGINGKDGRDGVDGQKGADGLNGKDGLHGKDGVDGLPGKDGRDGDAGPRGERGEPGEKGEPGERGRDGVDGRDGEKGEPGERGEPGEPGRDGKDGVNGLDGKDGTPGRDGAAGEKGLQGERGEKGEKGDPGLNGKDGMDAILPDLSILEFAPPELAERIGAAVKKMMEFPQTKIAEVTEKSIPIPSFNINLPPQPAPVVNHMPVTEIHMPKKGKEVTTVTGYDANGRITSFEKAEVEE